MSETGRTIRGLSIAVTVLAGLAIVLALGLTALSGLFAIGIVDDDSIRYSNATHIDIDDLDLSPSDIRELRSLGIDVDDLELDITQGEAIAGLVLFFMILSAFITFLVGALSLVAGILGIARWRRPDKMQAVFVWAIIAAVFSLFIGRLISLVLLIILAVEAYRYRKDHMSMPQSDPMQGWSA